MALVSIPLSNVSSETPVHDVSSLCSLGDIGGSLGQLPHDDRVLHLSLRHLRQLRAGRGARLLPGRYDGEGDRPLGNVVRVLTPGIHRLVPAPVDRPEEGAMLSPVTRT
jgi:hypothetical protein